ncbi:MAG: SDR family NAD(P)-dependent oxidoreductase, partial [Acidimicrobiales bacterium]
MEPGRFLGQAVVITGGASPIGRATVRRLQAEGASVVAGDIDEEGLAQLEDESGEH